MDQTLKASFMAWRHKHSVMFPLPTTEKKSHRKTEVFYLGAVAANSSTSEGTAQVHEYLMQHELKIPLESSDDIFRTRLFLFHGDQKTVENGRAARIEQEDSECAFNTRNWLLPIPALFHVQMNLSTVFLRMFWAPFNKPGDQLRTTHCILADMQRFGFKNITQDKAPWYDLHRLLQMGYYSRVLATFLQCLEHHGVVQRANHKGASSLHDVMSKLSPSDFNIIWNSVHKVLFSKHAMNGKIVYESEDGTADEVLELPNHMITLARFVQTQHVYLLLSQAIRYGDVQTIRHLLPLLALLFIGAEKNKYGREILYLIWLLSDDVSDMKLQDAILDSLLINVSGRTDSFLPVDRFLEHINAVLKIDQKLEKNSTHDWRQTFHSTVRCIPYLAGLKKAMERMVSYTVKGKHSIKDMSADILDFAIKLWHDDQVNFEKKLAGQYVADDIIQLGLKRLPKAIQSFNEDVVDHPNRQFTATSTSHEERNDAGVDGFNTVDQPATDTDPLIRRMTAEDSIAELGELAEHGALNDIAAYYGKESHGDEVNDE